jgi:osmoprotectant transport system ATP-binding protein
LKEIFQRLNQTAILVTHDLAEAAYLGDHIVLMEAGLVAQQGSISVLRDNPATPFVKEFLEAQRSLTVV